MKKLNECSLQPTMKKFERVHRVQSDARRQDAFIQNVLRAMQRMRRTGGFVVRSEPHHGRWVSFPEKREIFRGHDWHDVARALASEQLRGDVHRQPCGSRVVHRRWIRNSLHAIVLRFKRCRCRATVRAGDGRSHVGNFLLKFRKSLRIERSQRALQTRRVWHDVARRSRVEHGDADHHAI